LENARKLQTTVGALEAFVAQLKQGLSAEAVKEGLLACQRSAEEEIVSPGGTCQPQQRKARVKKGNEAAELYKVKTNLTPVRFMRFVRVTFPWVRPMPNRFVLVGGGSRT
jgi:hypothetical protein